MCFSWRDSLPGVKPGMIGAHQIIQIDETDTEDEISDAKPELDESVPPSLVSRHNARVEIPVNAEIIEISDTEMDDETSSSIASSHTLGRTPSPLTNLKNDTGSPQSDDEMKDTSPLISDNSDDNSSARSIHDYPESAQSDDEMEDASPLISDNSDDDSSARSIHDYPESAQSDDEMEDASPLISDNSDDDSSAESIPTDTASSTAIPASFSSDVSHNNDQSDESVTDDTTSSEASRSSPSNDSNASSNVSSNNENSSQSIPDDTSWQGISPSPEIESHRSNTSSSPDPSEASSSDSPEHTPPHDSDPDDDGSDDDGSDDDGSDDDGSDDDSSDESTDGEDSDDEDRQRIYIHHGRHSAGTPRVFSNLGGNDKIIDIEGFRVRIRWDIFHMSGIDREKLEPGPQRFIHSQQKRMIAPDVPVWARHLIEEALESCDQTRTYSHTRPYRKDIEKIMPDPARGRPAGVPNWVAVQTLFCFAFRRQAVLKKFQKLLDDWGFGWMSRPLPQFIEDNEGLWVRDPDNANAPRYPVVQYPQVDRYIYRSRKDKYRNHPIYQRHPETGQWTVRQEMLCDAFPAEPEDVVACVDRIEVDPRGVVTYVGPIRDGSPSNGRRNSNIYDIEGRFVQSMQQGIAEFEARRIRDAEAMTASSDGDSSGASEETDAQAAEEGDPQAAEETHAGSDATEETESQTSEETGLQSSSDESDE